MELIWRDTYERAVDLFGGQRPGAQLEAELVERFETHPAAVVAAVEKLGERFRAGRVRSPWPLVLREMDAAPDRDAIRASDESDRARAVHLAEMLVRNIGHCVMDEPELHAMVFEDRGSLLERFDTPELRARMVSQWHAVHPPTT